ncbi:putative deferrochelatase/peroxidase YfeX [Schistosoma japonicum]|uniref:Putative deferrochelatase/peroxidase YfeX n=1 Tax=Schistosoma japonicum TaxID=6182 RepID=A0A4Z2CWY1_SCHJA|nr:putative deferrochelatase/peroxidase YfeX [Schistosoma japonicum]
MCRYVKKLAWLFCLLITCNLNPTYPNGKSSFAAAYFLRFTPQSSVITDLKSHALYLTIHLNSNASTLECLRSIGRIRKYINKLCPPYSCRENNEIFYGIGFGVQFYKNISPDFQCRGVENYEYRERTGKFGKLPKTDGDIFIHAKCNNYGILFDLAKYIIYNMPSGSVDKFEDIYGFKFRGGRDLSGFEDGTKNPKSIRRRIEVAINKRTGGSYALAQRWVHNMSLLEETNDRIKEEWIGRTLKESYELANKRDVSHVARMVGSEEYHKEPKYKILRQSLPYGTLSDKSGLQFMAYSSDLINLEFMLNRMTDSHSDDKKNDYIMIFSKCSTGNYWYFPSYNELIHLIDNEYRKHRYPM